MSNLDYEAPLSSMSVWVLAALAVEPCHMYGVEGRIYSLSLASLTPNSGSIKRTVHSLMQRGLIELVDEEPGRRSGRNRRLYGLTSLGWRQLRIERRRLDHVVRAVDRALAQRMFA